MHIYREREIEREIHTHANYMIHGASGAQTPAAGQIS